MNHTFDAAIAASGRIGGSLRPLAAIAALSWLAVACAPTLHDGSDTASPRQVLAVAIENLAERYIEPVDTGSVTLAGLTRLASLDSALALHREGAAVRLDVGAEMRAEHQTPAGDDLYGWAWLAADVIDDVRRNSTVIGGLANEDVYETVFDGALARFDRYSRYTSAETARRNRAARDGFGGLGVSIAQEEGITVITQVHKDTPAARAGLKVDDRITHVDGKPITDLPLNKVVGLVRGPVESRVALQVLRPGAPQPFEVALRRMHIVLPTVTARRNGGLLEIKLNGFNKGTARALRRELERAEREMGKLLKGVILDMRGNPGGLLDQAVAVADLFLAHGRIVSTRGRHAESNQVFDATPGEYARGRPLAVLINGRSASAAEIVAVALRDAGRAVLVGSTSFGKGSVQTIARLPNGGEITLTWARLLAPSGQTLDRQGIVPALCTGGSAQALDALIKALNAADGTATPLPAALLRPQAGAPHFSAEGRGACPPSTAESPVDLETARIVLGNRVVYAQAVSGIPAVAKRH